VGRSGQGKSTFLNILGLLDRPTSGAFLCNGEDVTNYNDAESSRLRGEYFGFIFQQFFLSDRRSALENVAEPFLYSHSRNFDSRLEVAAHLMEKVGLTHRLHARPSQLSGGEQQRVAIARALAMRPQVVLADEPTGSLDAANGEQVIELLFNLVRTEGLTLILVSHDESIARRADRTLVLQNGKLYSGDAM
jgi:putative ABC transport system ATP-binding protein